MKLYNCVQINNYYQRVIDVIVYKLVWFGFFNCLSTFIRNIWSFRIIQTTDYYIQIKKVWIKKMIAIEHYK